MRNFWSALALLIALAIGCWLAAARVGTLTEQTAAELEAARVAAQEENMAAAQNCVEAAAKLWQGHEGFWGTVLRHTETDALSYRFEALRQWAALQDREEVLCGIAELKAMLRHLADMEQAFYYNFL